MDKQIKQKWLDALMSGEYKKGETFLRHRADDSEVWCCLGVLCNIVDPDGWSEPVAETNYTFVHTFHNVSYLPSKILTMLDDNISVAYEHQKQLALLNDRAETFDDAANYIARNL